MMKTEGNPRHDQLIQLGFWVDDSSQINIYNHDNGMWIADFALDQYSNKEWDAFLAEYDTALNNPEI